MRRMLSLWLPRFALESYRARETHQAPHRNKLTAGEKGLSKPSSGLERPFVLLATQVGRDLVVASDPKGEALGLVPGLPLADARALAPMLQSAPWDPEATTQSLSRLAAWATRYSPWTRPCPHSCHHHLWGPEPLSKEAEAGLLMEITGCAHFFARPGDNQDRTKNIMIPEGEESLLKDILKRLADGGFTARAAIADSIGAAWALARFTTDANQPYRIAAPKGSRAALRSLPPAALRLPYEAVELLARFGIHRIADLEALPAVTLAARFGKVVNQRLRQALDQESECLDPDQAVAPLQVRMVLAEPISDAEAIEGLLESLIAALCRRLEDSRQGARKIDLLCYRVDASLVKLTRGTSRPTREPRHLERLFTDAMGEIDPGFGIESLILQAPQIEALESDQLGLSLPQETPCGARETTRSGTDLARLTDRLEARLGSNCLFFPQARQSHLPECAVAYHPARQGPPALARGQGALPEVSPSLWRPAFQRPLRLLPRPEPVEATALLPDYPPQQFRWRRLLHQVIAAEGPERLTDEWWLIQEEEALAANEDPITIATRDYFRVAVHEGGRYWLYRSDRRWYLHGIFA